MPKKSYCTYEVYQVNSKHDPHWWEYIVTLLDANGHVLDEWDSVDGYNSHAQKLTKKEAELTCKEIAADVKAGRIETWFCVGA